MREMAAPRSRASAARRDREDGFDEEGGRLSAAESVDAGKGSLKSTFPWRRCVIALSCLALFGGSASFLSGGRGRGTVAEIARADSPDDSSAPQESGVDSSTKKTAPKPRADPLGIGDVLTPLVEVALLSEKRPDSAELSKLPAKEPVTVLQVAAAESAGHRLVRIKTASGKIGWVNYLSETGARIFSVEKKASKAKRPQRPATKRVPQQRPAMSAYRKQPLSQGLSQRKQRQQAKPRRPPHGAATSWGNKRAPPKLPAQPGRPINPGRFGKPPAQRPKRAVPGGFGWPKPKAARASRPARSVKRQQPAARSVPKASKVNAKPPPMAAGKRQRRGKR